jgi:hypothetical protein
LPRPITSGRMRIEEYGAGNGGDDM